MTIKTRFFGKRINGEPLKNLIAALGEDSKPILQTPNKRWLTRDVYGRVSFVPTKEGVNVDLYIFREDYHINEGSVPMITLNYLPSPNSLFSITNSNRKETQIFNHHIQGEIKYQNKESNSKLKC